MGVLPKALHSVDDSADEDQPWGSPDSGDVDVDVYAGLLRVFAGDLGDLYENGCKYYTFVPSTLSSKEWVIIKKLLQPCKTCQYERATKGNMPHVYHSTAVVFWEDFETSPPPWLASMNTETPFTQKTFSPCFASYSN